MFFVELLTATLAERSKSLSEQESLNARLGHFAEEDAALECGNLVDRLYSLRVLPLGICLGQSVCQPSAPKFQTLQ